MGGKFLLSGGRVSFRPLVFDLPLFRESLGFPGALGFSGEEGAGGGTGAADTSGAPSGAGGAGVNHPLMKVAEELVANLRLKMELVEGGVLTFLCSNWFGCRWCRW